MQHPPGYPPPGPWQPQRPHHAPPPGYWPTPQGYGPPPQPPRPGLSAAVIVLIVIVGTMALGGAGCLVCVCAARSSGSSPTAPATTTVKERSRDDEAVVKRKLRDFPELEATVVEVEVTRDIENGKVVHRSATVRTLIVGDDESANRHGKTICNVVAKLTFPDMRGVRVDGIHGQRLANCHREW